MTNDQYKYIAFISYRHNASDDKERLDEQWARKIQDTLESYRLPNAVFKSVYKAEKRVLPKRLYPVFRDTSDLGVGTLKDVLEQNLKGSRFLIVICTPRTAQPNEDGKLWVDDEVKYFADTLGRQDRVIPILVSGTPSESFVPTLKKYDCLALDVGKFSQERIVNDIVAKILGLNPDELWNRELRRRKRQRIRRCLIGAGLAALCAFGSWFAHDWNREKQVYFADYVDCWGVPKGLCRLLPEQLRGRGQAYRFHYRGYDSFNPWKRKAILRKAFCVNSFDRICKEDCTLPLHAPTAGRLFFYDEDFALTKVIHLEINGVTNSVYNYSGHTASVVDVIRRGWDGRLGTCAGMLDAGKENVDLIRRYRVTRDGSGHVTRIEGFRDAKGIPAKDAQGVHRTDFVLDDLGRVVKESYYDWNGEKVLRDTDGARSFTYDSNGKVIEIHHLTDVGEDRVSSVERQSFEQDGNLTEIRKISYESAGQTVTNLWIRYAYDANGQCRLVERYDSEGALIKSDVVAARQVRVNKFVDGRLSERDESSYFSGKDGSCPSNVCLRRIERYDVNMHCIEIVKYGMDGKLLQPGDGAAHTKRKYDAEGREVDFATFDVAGKPWADKGGIARKTHEFDLNDAGLLLKTICYYGTNNSPICTPDVGGAKEEMLIDKNGRLMSIRLLGCTGEPIVGRAKWHKATFKHNQFGFLSEIAYWGIDGKRVKAHGFGKRMGDVAIQRYEINAAGQVVEQVLYDANEQLMVGCEGWASIRKAYNGKGQLAEVFLFGADGRPVEPKNGINCHTQYEYSKAGKKIRQRAYKLDGGYFACDYDDNGYEICNREFNPDGSPRADKDGIHATYFKRDGQGREVKRGFFDIHGKRVLCEDRYAAFETRYDDHGSFCEDVRYGTHGELVRDKNGVCIVRCHFDENHRDTGRSFYDTQTNLVENKEGVAGVRKAYDAAGNKTEEYGIDRSGNPIVDRNGVSISHDDYDSHRRIVKRTFLDGARKPILSTEGIAGWTFEYEGKSTRKSACRYFDLEGKACHVTGGRAGWLHTYDERGNLTREVNIDKFGKPFPSQDGTVGSETKYDVKNRPIQLIQIGRDLRPTPCTLRDNRAFKQPVKCSRCDVRYDDLSGRRIETMTLVDGYKGIARCAVEYDRDGNRVDVRFEDDRGNLVNNIDVGCAHVASEFDEYGDLSVRRWYDADGELKSTGCARWVRSVKRSEKGLTVEMNYYDAQGFPTLNEDGISFARLRYDREYRLTGQEYYDEHRKPCTGNRSMFAKLTVRRDGNGRVVEMCGTNANGDGAWGNDGAVAKMELCYLSDEKVIIVLYNAEGVRIGERKVSKREADAELEEVNVLRYSPER